MPMLPLRAETLKDARCFVRYWDQIEHLRREAGLQDDVLLNPLHFMATTDHTRRSCSVACWRGEELVGLMYATEYMLIGVGTGYSIGGDYAGRGLLLCRAEFEAEVIAASIDHMTSRGIHSLHLRLLRRDDLHPVLAQAKIQCLDGLIPGDRLVLASDFEQFLGSLGGHTRRNVRNYMRKATQAGINFIPSLSEEEYRAGVDKLNVQSAFQAEPLRLARDERLLALHSGTQRFGLRASDGRLVSVLCGFRQGNRFHLLTQLNDVHLKHLSLSLVLRGHTVAHLIASGHTELQFVGGSSLILGRFCTPERYRSIFVDKRKGIAAVLKRLAWEATKVIKMMEKPVPEKFKLICNGNLEAGELLERTVLAPAALVFPGEKSV